MACKSTIRRFSQKLQSLSLARQFAYCLLPTAYSSNSRSTKIPTSVILLIAFISIFTTGCMKPLQTAKPPGHTVLFNSFETAQDTLSWYWSGDYRLINDTPPSGGNYALEVKGGKVLPAGSFISRPLRYGGYFTIQCWGKVKDIGGYIQLSTIADHEVGEAVRVHILDPHWRFTQSADTLFCPPNQSLMLTIQPGLLKDGTMAVDLIQVQKVGKAGKNSAQNGKRVARR